MHQDPDRDRYTSDEEGTVVDNAADDLELIQINYTWYGRPYQPGAICVGSNSFGEDMVVKLMDDAHAPEIKSGQLNVVKTYLKARYWLPDLLRAQ